MIDPTSLQSNGLPATQVSQSQASFAANKDQFLKLLLVQLKNQDPLQPPDADKMTDQITQFGQLEQLMNLNTSMNNLSTQQAQATKGQALEMLGKTIQASSNTVRIAGDDHGTMGFAMPQDSNNVTLEVFDSFGNSVRTVDYGPASAGPIFYEFDGRDNEGHALPNGSYRYEVTAKTANNVSYSVSPIMQGIVNQVAFENGQPVVNVGGRYFTMDQILSVSSL